MHRPCPGALQAAGLTPEQASTPPRLAAGQPPPLRLDDKQEGGVSAWALPSPAVSLQSTGSLEVCVALIREAALNLTVTPALRSVAQTKVHLCLLKSQDKESVGHRCCCCPSEARAFIPGWMNQPSGRACSSYTCLVGFNLSSGVYL